MSVYTDKVRLFVCKIDDDEYEIVGPCSSFDDGLISDVNDNHSLDILEVELSNSGWDLFDDDIQTVVGQYQVDDVIEIVGDTRLEYVIMGGYLDAEETDLGAFLVDVKHRKLTSDQIERFVPDLLDRDDGDEIEL